MTYLMGVDIGTSGTKVLLCSSSGDVVARATVEYPLHTPRPGWAEQHAEDWWHATVQGIRHVLATPGVKGEDVACVGLTGQMHSLVLLDEHQDVIRPPILWCDVRTTEECKEIEDLAGGRSHLIDMTGNRALEGFTAPKLMWVRKHEPENYARTQWIMLPKDFVRLKLTGEIATDISDASGTLLVDVANRRWSEPLLKALGVKPKWLPPILESSDVAGHITPEAAEVTGLLPGTPVVAGGADNTCGAIGAGVVRPGQALISIGSSGVVFVPTDRPLYQPDGAIHTFAHSVPGVWYLMGVTLAAGLSLRWVRDELAQVEQTAAELVGTDAYDLLTKQAAQAPPGSGGLFFLPYLNGERTPHIDANARGVWFGLSTAHRRAHLVRSVFEGITYSLRDCLDPIRSMGVPVDQAHVIGGGGKSDFWVQMVADILGITARRVSVDEGPAFGAALLAGIGVGVYTDPVQATSQTIEVYDAAQPNPEQSRMYDQRYHAYRSLYPALRDSFQELAKWQE